MGFAFEVEGLEFEIEEIRYRVEDLGSRVWSLGFLVFRIWCSRFGGCTLSGRPGKFPHAGDSTWLRDQGFGFRV